MATEIMTMGDINLPEQMSGLVDDAVWVSAVLVWYDLPQL